MNKLTCTIACGLVLLTGCTASTSTQGPVSEAAMVEESIHLGGEWFLHNFDADVFLHYGYNPVEQRWDSSNNYLRKFGALWSITELFRYTDDEHFQELSRHGLHYFRKKFFEGEDGDYLYVEYDNKAKLGYNAFAILSLINIDGYKKREEYLDKFAAGIQYQQQEDGSYKTFFNSDRATGQDYYPGEANLAMMTLYEHTGDEQYKDTVLKSFPYYRDYWRETRNLAFIPWQTQAFAKLYRATGDPEIRDFVFEMNDELLTHQQTPEDHNDPVNIGGIRSAPGISTSSYLEGLTDAYALARDVGDAARTLAYGDASRHAARFVMRLQYRPDNMMELSKLDDLSLGGFKQSLSNPALRVDNNQHAVAALMKVQNERLFE